MTSTWKSEREADRLAAGKGIGAARKRGSRAAASWSRRDRRVALACRDRARGLLCGGVRPPATLSDRRPQHTVLDGHRSRARLRGPSDRGDAHLRRSSVCDQEAEASKEPGLCDFFSGRRPEQRRIGVRIRSLGGGWDAPRVLPIEIVLLRCRDPSSCRSDPRPHATYSLS